MGKHWIGPVSLNAIHPYRISQFYSLLSTNMEKKMHKRAG